MRSGGKRAALVQPDRHEHAHARTHARLKKEPNLKLTQNRVCSIYSFIHLFSINYKMVHSPDKNPEISEIIVFRPDAVVVCMFFNFHLNL